MIHLAFTLLGFYAFAILLAWGAHWLTNANDEINVTSRSDLQDP
jgi:hypothetical protein